MNHRYFAVEYGMRFIGKWYKWGGDDPSGFDCSGLVIEILKATGVLDRSVDMTAQGLYNTFKPFPTKNPRAGCLVFWQNMAGKVIHVEMMVSTELALGASGGGSRTRTVEDAIKQNAFIKVRPAATREGIVGFFDPFRKI